jgi:hypothetical protein
LDDAAGSAQSFEQHRLSPTRIKTQLGPVKQRAAPKEKAVSVQTYCLFSWPNSALIPKLLAVFLKSHDLK